MRRDIYDNVYCIDEKGNVVWRVNIQPAPPADMPAIRCFVNIWLTKDSERKDEKAFGVNALIGLTFFGNRFIIDKETGETIGQLEAMR